MPDSYPPYSPYPPPELPRHSPDRPRHSTARVFAIVGAVALSIAGVGLVAWATLGRDTGPTHPDEWDARVAGIAAFVESERSLEFDHPVQVDFLPDEEFTADVRASEADLTDEDRESIEQSEALLRALGLVEGDVDLFEEQNQLVGEGTLAYYDPEQKLIRVRGTELTPDLRVTLAHELTHALQDQVFDLQKVEEDLDEDAQLAYRAVIEGDATNVEDAYIDDELTAAELEDYETNTNEQVDEADLEGIPPVLIAFFQAPYAIGPSFASIVREELGTSGLNEALRTPPESERQLLDPAAYFADERPEDIDVPTAPNAAESLDDGQFGALAWYIVLASRIDPVDALHAVDGWAGDGYVTYEGAAGPCVTARFRGTTTDATRRMREALDAWVSFSRPGEAHVTGIDERTVELTACDPGSEAPSEGPTPSVEALLTAPAARLAITDDVLTNVSGADFDEAWCVGDGVVDELGVEELNAETLTPAAEQTYIEVLDRCGLRGG